MSTKDLEAYRKRAEEKVRRMPPRFPDRKDARNAYELEVEKVELEMQNDELRVLHMALEDSHQNYADLYDFAPVGYFTFDAHGFIRELNLTGADMLEAPRARLMNHLFKRYVMAEDVPIYEDHLARVCGDVSKQTCELRLKNKTVAYVQLESIPVTESDGGHRCRTTMIDISARKRAELVAQESQAQFHLLVDGVQDYAILMVSNDATIVSWNVGAQRILGYREHEIIGRAFAAIFVPEDVAADVPQKELSRAVADGRSLDERWHMRKDGSRFWASGVVTCLRDERGTVVGYAKILRDMTTHKRYEEERERLLHELEAGHARLEAVLQQMPAAVIMIDAGGRLLLQNQLVEEIIGSLAGQTLEAWARQHPLYYADGSAYDLRDWPLSRSLREGEVIASEEIDYRWPDGRSGTLAVASAPVRNSEGDVIAAVATFTDITEQKQAQGELGIASKLESIGLLAGGIAHDFNNALTAILGNVSLAKLSPQNNASAKALSEAEAACLRASELTKRLLTFSKGGAPIKAQTSLTGLLNSAADFIGKKTGVRLELSVAADLWTVDHDAGQMRQVIKNLVLNAQEAMPRGGTVRLSATNVLVPQDDTPPLAPGPYVKISVEDEGVGIAKDRLGKVFDPFYTTKPNASGLGLTTAYWIVQKHQGHATAESEVDKGTQMHLYLPAHDVAEAKPKSPSVLHQQSKAGRILVMDDEVLIRDLLKKLLEHGGYEVEIVSDGAATVSRYREEYEARRPFDVVILDLTVPGGMGGKEAIAKLREIDPHVIAIVSSGYTADPVLADFQTHGFSARVSKPYRTEEMSEKLTELMHLRSTMKPGTDEQSSSGTHPEKD